MATWKKVIVSGSNAELNQLSVGSNQQITTNPSTTYLSGSFSGSFFGDGSGISGIAASFPITQKSNLTGSDSIFINDGASKYVTYSDLLTDLAGTNLTVESGDSLTLASDITGLNSVSATSFTGSLEGTASYASYALTASYALNATANTGDITFEGIKIIGAGTGSGDGNNFSTMELVPDNSRYSGDQYLIIDPTSPNHIHIRPGGAVDNSAAELFLGGETSYFKLGSGIDPTPYIASSGSVWSFGNNGGITFPDSTVQTTAYPGPIFATTGSNTFTADQTINGNIILDSNGQIRITNPASSSLFGLFDGSIQGAYFQIFGKNYATADQKGTAEFVFDSSTGGGAFNVAEFNGSTWIKKFTVNANGAIVTGSLIVTNGITGSLEGTASYATAVQSIQNNVTNNTNNYLLTATGGGDVNGEANLTFDGSTLNVTGDITVSGDLTVNGTTTTINTNNLLVEDRFVLLASGSTANADGGIIVQNNADGSGFGYFLDSVTAPRWGFTSSLAGNATTVTADEYVVSARLDAGTWSAGGTAPTYGGSGAGYGNIVVDNNSDIWIYA